ncbi:MAG: winged helix DNA-binding domain-containing protein [Lewinellaceae bacterium]|nr:winged helix DNA-binding domain-containing protein [Lewinellaceae bacterium]
MHSGFKTSKLHTRPSPHPNKWRHGSARCRHRNTATPNGPVGLRIPGSTDADIEKAIDRGDIVRTHVLRPTWHFAAAEDIRWMLALSAPQVRAAGAAMERQLGLDAALFKRTNTLIYKALEGGKQLTREELMAELAKSGIITNGYQAAHHVPRRIGCPCVQRLAAG